jgi:hypothetical protein
MNRAIIATAAALLVASPALAQTTSQGAKQYAPGQQPNTTAGPGHSESAPGQQKNTTAGPGHSESAPGQKMKNPTTTGSGTGKKY